MGAGGFSHRYMPIWAEYGTTDGFGSIILGGRIISIFGFWSHFVGDNSVIYDQNDQYP